MTYTHDGGIATSDTFTLIEEVEYAFVTFNITIVPASSSIVIAPSALPAMSAGAPVNVTLTASGGTAPYTWSVSGGTLPPGLVLGSTGVLSGTPTQRGGYSFEVRAEDATGDAVVRGYSGTVENPSLTLGATSAGTAIQGIPFSQTLAASGGVAPYSYQLEAGILPTGLSLAGDTISGTTNVAAGSYPITMRVTDSSGGPGSFYALETYTLTVAPAPTVWIGVSPASVGEDDATNLVFTLTRSVALSSPTVVNLALSGTATSGDYTGGASTLSIPAGATSATLTIDPTADALVEPDETVIVTIGTGAGYTVGTPANATGTILNDDLPTLSIADVSQSEGNAGTTSFTFTVSLNAPAGAGGVSFDIATQDGTALAGSDYTANSLTGQTIPAGSSSYTFTVLASGDTLHEADETFFVNVTNVTGATAGDTQAVGTIVNDEPVPSLSINDVSLPEGDAGTTSATFTVTLSGASSQAVSVNYATANGTAQAGSDYVAASGTLSFSPGATSQTVTVTVNGDIVTEADETYFVNLSTATNATILDASGQGTITNDDIPVTIAPVALANGTAWAAYSATISASGGTAPYTYAISAGALPQGLTLSTSGVLSGTPIATGSYTFTVTATDTLGRTGSQPYTFTINAPTIVVAPATVPNSGAGTAYSQSITASGGGAPYSYAITAGALPPGLTLSASGTLSGTATAVGTFNFTVTATDAGGYTGSRAYTLSVFSPNFTLGPAPAPASYAVPYSHTVTAGGGTAPYTYSIMSGALPPGLSLNAASGEISGTPTATGTFNFVLVARDSTTGPGAPFGVASGYAITVAAPAITLSPASLASGAVGAAYGGNIVAAGGIGPYSYAVTAGALPAGMTLSSGGLLTGTPIVAGSYGFTVSATDANGQSGSQAYTLAIAAPSLTLSPAAGALPSALYNNAYSQVFTAAGGIAPYTYSLVSGALPAGLTLMADGSLSGTPTVSGSFSFSVRATDSSGGVGAPFWIDGAYTLSVAAPAIALTPAALADGVAGTAYSQTIGASGGVAPYTFAATGTLPAGVTLAADGTLAGTPNEAGTFNFTVTATDANGQSGALAYVLRIAAPTLSVGPAAGALPAARAGSAYLQALQVSGGRAPYTAALSGALPTGIVFDAASMEFSGTPTQAGDFNLTVTITDSTPGISASVVVAYTLAVAAPTLSLVPGTLEDAAAGQPYTQALVASGGLAPYQYAVSAGALPAGLALDPATGVLAGTPGEAGDFGFDVTATDSTTGIAGSVTVQYVLAVAAPAIVIDPEALPQALQLADYSQMLSARGGTAPYAFSIDAGALPAGLTLSTQGLLSGAPSESGTFNLTVRATDAGGFSGTRAYALEVIARPDPTRDPEVRGLLDAQAAATRRFASSQINNFQQRMEQLHGTSESGPTLRNGLSISTRESCPDNRFYAVDHPCHRDARQRDQARIGGGAEADPPGSENNPDARRLGYWTGGTLRSGSFDGQAGGRGFDFETEGVSGGADYRVFQDLAVGAGLGYGQDSSTVGQNGSQLRGRARTLALYGSFQPAGTLFVDALVGYQALSFELERFVTASGGQVRGSRDGDQLFGSLSIGSDLVRGEWMFTPYARLDAMRAALEPYTESGDDRHALTYGEQDVDTTTGNLGLRMAFNRATGWGALSPQLRLEYQHDFNAEGGASMQYADLLGPVYTTSVDGYDRSRFTLGLGVLFELRRWSIQVDYRGVVGSGEQRDNAIQLMFQTGR
ncbi:putative Ig domain-containing protein [Luteimonas sp. SDU101]|uniref:putative Ig domain-containing protein n=1 Tax=Luteimonas sp. SDU101 TaxID=3422593 RepID=UPI003EB816A9